MTDIAPVQTQDMTAEEGSRLGELERKIEAAMRRAATAIGPLLREIRDSRLYRASHRSFEAYCLDRFDISRSTAYRMIGPSEEPPALGHSDPSEDKTAGQHVPEWDTSASANGSGEADSRRHQTLDQPPETIPAPTEPMAPKRPAPEPEKPESKPPKAEPVKARLIPTMPPPRNSTEIDNTPKHDRSGSNVLGAGAFPGPARQQSLTDRNGLNKIIALLSSFDDDDLARMSNLATGPECAVVGRAAQPFASRQRHLQKMADDNFATPAECDHPITRLLGDTCGKCGRKMTKVSQ